MTPIKDSSNVESAHHNGGGLLTVRFKGGVEGTYQNVTAKQFKAFMDAPSKGGWIVENLIRKPHTHPWTKTGPLKKKK